MREDAVIAWTHGADEVTRSSRRGAISCADA